MLFHLTKNKMGLFLALTSDAIVFKPHFLCSWMPTLPAAKCESPYCVSTRAPLHSALWIIFQWLILHSLRCAFLQRHSPALSRWIIGLWEIMRPNTSISNCTLNSSCSVFCLYKKCKKWKGSEIDCRGNTGGAHVLYIHLCSALSFSSSTSCHRAH